MVSGRFYRFKGNERERLSYRTGAGRWAQIKSGKAGGLRETTRTLTATSTTMAVCSAHDHRLFLERKGHVPAAPSKGAPRRVEDLSLASILREVDCRVGRRRTARSTPPAPAWCAGGGQQDRDHQSHGLIGIAVRWQVERLQLNARGHLANMSLLGGAEVESESRKHKNRRVRGESGPVSCRWMGRRQMGWDSRTGGRRWPRV